LISIELAVSLWVGVMARGHIFLGAVLAVLACTRGMAEVDDNSLMQKKRAAHQNKRSQDLHRRGSSNMSKSEIQNNGQTVAEQIEDGIEAKQEFDNWVRNFVDFEAFRDAVSKKCGKDYRFDARQRHVGDVSNFPDMFAVLKACESGNPYLAADGTPLDIKSDLDGDGYPNSVDGDIDGDHVFNGDDAFPKNIFESRDTDVDGIGDNAEVSPFADYDEDGILNAWDPDEDDDGLADDDGDAVPFDDQAQFDIDRDNIPDEFDAFPDRPKYWADYNADGVPDLEEDDPDGNGMKRHLDDWYM